MRPRFPRWLALLLPLLLCVSACLLGIKARAGNFTSPLPKPKLPIVEVHLWVGKDVAPGPNIRLSINTRNAQTIQLSAYKIDSTEYILHRAERGADQSLAQPHKLAGTWPLRIEDPQTPPNVAQRDVYRSRQINLPRLPPGVYLLAARAVGQEAFAVVNITDLAIVLKRGPHSLLAWVTDHHTGELVVHARVQLWNRSPLHLVMQGFTGTDGVCTFPTAPRPDQILLVERSGAHPDIAGVATAGQNPDGRLVGHLQTDRPVYRPGATVEFRAILRRTLGRGYTPDAKADYHVEIRDSHDNVIRRTTVRTTAIGTLADSVEIESGAALGAYSIVLTPTKGEGAIYQTFTVAEYRKPEFQATVSAVQPRYLAGEKAAFTVKASYYFGAPLAHAQVKYQVRRTPNPFSGGNFGDESEQALWFSGGDGNLYERDTYASQPFVAEGTAETDAKGEVVVPVETGRDLPDMTYSISCTVIDGQRRQVEASGAVPVYAASVRVGISSRLLTVTVGSIVPVDLRLADLDGHPVGGKIVLRTQQHVWDEKIKDTKVVVLSRTNITVGANGKAVGTIPMLAEGEVEIVAEAGDGTGRKARATTAVWTVGPWSKEPPTRRDAHPEPTVTVKLDRRIYHPGDSVQIYATTNTPGRPILLTVEGGALFQYVVVPRGTRSFHWTVRATVEMSPNGFVTAAQWARPAQLVTDSALMPIPDLTRQLKVTVETERSDYRPGDMAHYRIRVVDKLTGAPVNGAEASLAVVDESIYAVRPDTTADPYQTYWGQRENGVATESSAPEEVSGGAYQRNNPNGVASVRERFLDTAAWNAHAVTGPDGIANVSFELPGNLTSWRATAIAVTSGTQVGWGRSNVIVSRPVMLRLSTPRQFVQGDTIQLVGTVNNRTDRTLTFDVKLDPSLLTLAADQSATRVVEVAAKGEARVEWTVTAEKLPENGAMTAMVDGVLIARDLRPGEALADFSDHLRVHVPIRPHGVAAHSLVGDVLSANAQAVTLKVDLPADRIEPATMVTVAVENGVSQAAAAVANGVSRGELWDNGDAAVRLYFLTTPNTPASPRDVHQITRDLAILARYQRPDGGWGLWEDAPADIDVTAEAVQALGGLKTHPERLPQTLPFPDKLLARGIDAAQALYNQTGLWEDKARLAVALASINKAKVELVREVARRGGDGLSPYALLLLAEALSNAGAPAEAETLVSRVLPIAVAGPNTAYFPAGEHPGWQTNRQETTAQALLVLMRLQQAPELQSKLARFLADSANDGDYDAPLRTQATTARALMEYAQTHGGLRSAPIQAGDVSLTVNGMAVAFDRRAAGTEATAPLMAAIPRSLLRDGENQVVVQRVGAGSGEWFVNAAVTLYHPQPDETGAEMRVLRRFETQTVFGTWKTVHGGNPILPGRPVRVTVVVWPNDNADAVAVNEPLPCGFEFVDSELPGYAEEEVRDGAILHSLTATGATPLTFVYYIRAETEGVVTALPASAYLIRRPEISAGSAEEHLTVHEEAKK